MTTGKPIKFKINEEYGIKPIVFKVGYLFDKKSFNKIYDFKWDSGLRDLVHSIRHMQEETIELEI